MIEEKILEMNNSEKIKVEIKVIDINNLIISSKYTTGKLFHTYKTSNGKMKKCFMIKNKITRKNKYIPIINDELYMQGSKILTVIQKLDGELIPVLASSWTTHKISTIDIKSPIINTETNDQIKDENGNNLYRTKEVKESILNLSTDYGENKAWAVEFERMAINAYTIDSFFDQHQTAISISIVLISCFVGFMLLWSKI